MLACLSFGSVRFRLEKWPTIDLLVCGPMNVSVDEGAVRALCANNPGRMIELSREIGPRCCAHAAVRQRLDTMRSDWSSHASPDDTALMTVPKRPSPSKGQWLSDLPELRKRTIKEHLRELAVAGVATAPFGGGIAHLLTEYRSRRFERWAEAVESELGSLRAEVLDDDRFMDAFFRATALAVESHLDEKASMLAAALHELAENLDEWTDEIVTRMFLMVERFTPHHVQAMRILNATRQVHSVPKSNEQFALGLIRRGLLDGQRVTPLADGDPALQMAIVRDLDDFDLIDPDRASGSIVFGGATSAPRWYCSTVLSAEGQYLLRFLRYYEEPKAS